MVEAAALLEEAGFKKGSAEVTSLTNLETSIDGAKARAHAQAFVNTLTGGEKVAEAEAQLDGMGLEQGALAAVDPPLIEAPDTFSRKRPEHLVSFPPEFAVVPCKPLLFDIARGQITPPDLSSRVQARSGLLSRGLTKAGSYFWGGR